MTHRPDRSTPPAPHPLLRVRDVAERLAVPESTVRWWTRIGRLPHVRMGPRTPRYRVEDVEAFVAGRLDGVRP